MKYKVVRTNPLNYSYSGYYDCTLLQRCFDEGWQYKVCHEIKNKDGSTYLEYILVKKED